MKTIIPTLVLTLTLAACGGGGGGGSGSGGSTGATGTTPTPTPTTGTGTTTPTTGTTTGTTPTTGTGTGTTAGTTPTASARLEPYIGTWASECHVEADYTWRSVSAISRKDDTTLANKSHFDYYEPGSNCTGTIFATQTQTEIQTFTYVDSPTISIAVPPATTATDVAIDRVTNNTPATTFTLTGTKIDKGLDVNGKAATCATSVAGKRFCTVDSTTTEIITGTGGFFLRDGKLYQAKLEGSAWTVPFVLTKQ
jgi:hypothetical protein